MTKIKKTKRNKLMKMNYVEDQEATYDTFVHDLSKNVS